jgi:hypothetical protein
MENPSLFNPLFLTDKEGVIIQKSTTISRRWYAQNPSVPEVKPYADL